MAKELTGTVEFVMHDTETGKLNFMIAGDDGEGYTVTLNTYGFDSTNKKYVPNQEVYDAAQELLNILNEGSTIENAEETMDGAHVTFYSSEDGKKQSFRPGIGNADGASYTRFEKEISIPLSKQLTKLTEPVELEFFDNYKTGFRFNVGFPYDFKGETLNLRISQLRIPADEEDENSFDDDVSLKYGNSIVQQMQEKIRSGELEPDKESQLKESLERISDRLATQRALELESAMGERNLLDLVENPEKVRAYIHVKSFTTTEGPRFYLAAEVID